MNVWRLTCREIAYRKGGFALGAAAVFVAVGCLVAIVTLLRAHDGRMAQLNAEKHANTESIMAVAQDDYRKMMKTMGYNVVILNADEDLGQFWTNGFATKLMPEDVVTRLCNSDIASIQHLLPQVYEKILWKEQGDYPIILIGVRGEVMHQRSNKKEVMLEPVADGTMRIGHAAARKLGIKPGDTVTLLGAPFTVAETHPERGNTDDASVWIPMAKAQELLNKPGQISAILALSCLCAQGDLEKITREIAEILPETQVIHRVPEALIRLDARYRVAALSRETIDAEAAHHARMAGERQALASWMAPMAILAATAWIGLLAWTNVRERRAEIGLWRALGLRSSQILAVFLAKAVLMGLLGAILGYAVGFLAGIGWSAFEGVPVSAAAARALFDGRLLGLALVLAPLQACVASWLPTLVAARQDPAVILREE